jgi:hypothetical protein
MIVRKLGASEHAASSFLCCRMLNCFYLTTLCVSDYSSSYLVHPCGHLLAVWVTCVKKMATI